MRPEQRHVPACPELEPIEVVIGRVRPSLDAMTARFRIPPEDAEDIFQETLLLFLQKRALIRNDEGWIICVARRHCLQHLKARRERFHTSLDTAFGLASRSDNLGLKHDLTQALARVPERCRSLLRLRYRLGFGSNEVAEKLGYRPSSIRKIASRCVAALSSQLLFGKGTNVSDECGDD